MVDGHGLRAAIYLSGCSHHCPGCHNPDTHNPQNGKQLTHEMISEMAAQISQRPFLDGITLTGGDPLYDSYRTLAFISELVKKLDEKPNIWLYTGYTYEEVIELTHQNMAANVLINAYTDVLVDGPFLEEQANKTLAFIGSSNQRVIDLEKSIQNGKITLFSAL